MCVDRRDVVKSLLCGLVLLLLALTAGCGGDDTGHDAGSAGAGQATSGHARKAAAEPAPLTHDLHLNGVEKWQMDEHTRTVFTKMTGRLEGKSGDDAAVWKQAAGELNDDITELIQGCTMQGPAHDELHKYLVLYIPAVDKLAASNTKQSAERVQELLDLYPDYFE
jgi:hypothetical protein